MKRGITRPFVFVEIADFVPAWCMGKKTNEVDEVQADTGKVGLYLLECMLHSVICGMCVPFRQNSGCLSYSGLRATTVGPLLLRLVSLRSCPTVQH